MFRFRSLGYLVVRGKSAVLFFGATYKRTRTLKVEKLEGEFAMFAWSERVERKEKREGEESQRRTNLEEEGRRDERDLPQLQP